MPTVNVPAAMALAIPGTESSNAIHAEGATPRAEAPVKYGSGSGFPLVTSSPVISVRKVPSGSPSTTACASGRYDIVTRAMGMCASASEAISSCAPGLNGIRSRTRSITPRKSVCTTSSVASGNPNDRMMSADVVSSLPTMSIACSCVHSSP